MIIWAKVRKTDITTFHSPNFAHAVYGFKEMGAEVIEYEKIDEKFETKK